LIGFAKGSTIPTRLRIQSDPTGKSLAQLINPSVQPLLQKYSDFPKTKSAL
jgi:hypothetical protein